jgi:prolipoprotein diacylglyceryltransferase
MLAWYFGTWVSGLLIGITAGLALLRRRQLLTGASAGAFVCAWIGFSIGAKWHYRLEMLPWSEALLFPLGELLEGGDRTPLAVATAGACAAAWCGWRRLPWRDLGDALALAGMIGLSLGRVGCIIGGCCLGKVCPPWAAPLCVMPRYGSMEFMAQVALGQRSHALPVVPLSVLFSLVGLCIVVVLLVHLHRGAPRGRILAITCVAGPLAKGILEVLRAPPRPAALRIAFPLATAAVAAAVLGCMALWRVMTARSDAAQSDRTVGHSCDGSIASVLRDGQATH